jgi:hypothetical protein
VSARVRDLEQLLSEVEDALPYNAQVGGSQPSVLFHDHQSYAALIANFYDIICSSD